MGALNIGVLEEELQPMVDAWRKANPRIVRFWWAVDAAVKTCVKQHTATVTHGIHFVYRSGILFITLPSSRRLAYVKPRMLMDYPSDVTVKIDGIAASAASVIAMAGTKVCMSPTSIMMIHNPLTVAVGDSEEMRKAIQLLDEVKESIINAYEIKTGLSRVRLSHLMDGETWMNPKMALELGFCDEIMYQKESDAPEKIEDSFTYSRRAVTNSLLDKLKTRIAKPDNRVKAADLEHRLSLLNH